MSEYKVSKDDCIAHLQSRMLDQLRLVKWGMNTRCLYDALTFYNTYLCDDVDEKFHEQITGYLQANGFLLEERGIHKLWHFPVEPKGCLAKIYEAYRDSYEVAVRKAKEWALHEVNTFQNSNVGIVAIRCETFLHKKCLKEVLRKCKKLHFTTSQYFDEAFFVLYKRNIKAIQKLEWDASGTAERDFSTKKDLCIFELFTLLKLNADWKGMQASLRSGSESETERSIYRCVYYVPYFLQGAIQREIAQHLVADVSVFPMYSLGKYEALNEKGDNDVPIYFEKEEELAHDISSFCSWRLRLLEEKRRKESK